MIRQVVFLKSAEAFPQARRDALLRDLADRRSAIHGIQSVGTGRNILPEVGFVHGLTDLFRFDFRDPQARDAYLANDGHKANGHRIMANLDGGARGIFLCDSLP